MKVKSKELTILIILILVLYFIFLIKNKVSKKTNTISGSTKENKLENNTESKQLSKNIETKNSFLKRVERYSNFMATLNNFGNIINNYEDFEDSPEESEYLPGTDSNSNRSAENAIVPILNPSITKSTLQTLPYVTRPEITGETSLSGEDTYAMQTNDTQIIEKEIERLKQELKSVEEEIKKNPEDEELINVKKNLENLIKARSEGITDYTDNQQSFNATIPATIPTGPYGDEYWATKLPLENGKCPTVKALDSVIVQNEHGEIKDMKYGETPRFLCDSDSQYPKCVFPGNLMKDDGNFCNDKTDNSPEAQSHLNSIFPVPTTPLSTTTTIPTTNSLLPLPTESINLPNATEELTNLIKKWINESTNDLLDNLKKSQKDFEVDCKDFDDWDDGFNGIDEEARKIYEDEFKKYGESKLFPWTWVLEREKKETCRDYKFRCNTDISNVFKTEAKKNAFEAKKLKSPFEACCDCGGGTKYLKSLDNSTITKFFNTKIKPVINECLLILGFMITKQFKNVTNEELYMFNSKCGSLSIYDLKTSRTFRFNSNKYEINSTSKIFSLDISTECKTQQKELQEKVKEIDRLILSFVTEQKNFERYKEKFVNNFNNYVKQQPENEQEKYTDTELLNNSLEFLKIRINLLTDIQYPRGIFILIDKYLNEVKGKNENYKKISKLSPTQIEYIARRNILTDTEKDNQDYKILINNLNFIAKEVAGIWFQHITDLDRVVGDIKFSSLSEKSEYLENACKDKSKINVFYYEKSDWRKENKKFMNINPNNELYCFYNYSKFEETASKLYKETKNSFLLEDLLIKTYDKIFVNDIICCESLFTKDFFNRSSKIKNMKQLKDSKLTRFEVRNEFLKMIFDDQKKLRSLITEEKIKFIKKNAPYFQGDPTFSLKNYSQNWDRERNAWADIRNNLRLLNYRAIFLDFPEATYEDILSTNFTIKYNSPFTKTTDLRYVLDESSDDYKKLVYPNDYGAKGQYTVGGPRISIIEKFLKNFNSLGFDIRINDEVQKQESDKVIAWFNRIKKLEGKQKNLEMFSCQKLQRKLKCLHEYEKKTFRPEVLNGSWRTIPNKKILDEFEARLEINEMITRASLNEDNTMRYLKNFILRGIGCRKVLTQRSFVERRKGVCQVRSDGFPGAKQVLGPCYKKYEAKGELTTKKGKEVIDYCQLLFESDYLEHYNKCLFNKTKYIDNTFKRVEEQKDKITKEKLDKLLQKISKYAVSKYNTPLDLSLQSCADDASAFVQVDMCKAAPWKENNYDHCRGWTAASGCRKANGRGAWIRTVDDDIKLGGGFGKLNHYEKPYFSPKEPYCPKPPIPSPDDYVGLPKFKGDSDDDEYERNFGYPDKYYDTRIGRHYFDFQKRQAWEATPQDNISEVYTDVLKYIDLQNQITDILGKVEEIKGHFDMVNEYLGKLGKYESKFITKISDKLGAVSDHINKYVGKYVDKLGVLVEGVTFVFDYIIPLFTDPRKRATFVSDLLSWLSDDFSMDKINEDYLSNWGDSMRWYNDVDSRKRGEPYKRINVERSNIVTHRHRCVGSGSELPIIFINVFESVNVKSRKSLLHTPCCLVTGIKCHLSLKEFSEWIRKDKPRLSDKEYKDFENQYKKQLIDIYGTEYKDYPKNPPKCCTDTRDKWLFKGKSGCLNFKMHTQGDKNDWYGVCTSKPWYEYSKCNPERYTKCKEVKGQKYVGWYEPDNCIPNKEDEKCLKLYEKDKKNLETLSTVKAKCYEKANELKEYVNSMSLDSSERTPIFSQIDDYVFKRCEKVKRAYDKINKRIGNLDKFDDSFCSVVDKTIEYPDTSNNGFDFDKDKGRFIPNSEYGKMYTRITDGEKVCLDDISINDFSFKRLNETDVSKLSKDQLKKLGDVYMRGNLVDTKSNSFCVN